MSQIVIDDVKVSFAHRDVRLINDREMDQLKELVANEKKMYTHSILEEIVIMTDFLGPGMRFHTTTRVKVRGTNPG